MSPAVISLLGAVVGGLVGFVCARIVLPVVLRVQASGTADGKIATHVPAPAFAQDAGRLAAVTTAVYRYLFPVFFAVVGAIAASHIFAENAR